MHGRTFVQGAALAAVIVAAPCLATGSARAAGGHAASSPCATVTVKAKPSVNTAMIPETIKSTVTSCDMAKETVTLVQRISQPSATAFVPAARKWTITLAPGQAVTKTRSFPYVCCGSYTVRDRVLSAGGRLLASAHARFTFA